MSRVIPMFPIGHVTVPWTGVPLHIFEERYRALMSDLTDGTLDPAEFGMILIERGSEVGGGDTRASLGTLVQLLAHEQLPDGRWVILAGGSKRVRVVRWEPDAPYPRAEVEVLPPESWWGRDDELLAGAERQVRRAIALATELGETSVPLDSPRSEDPLVRSWQLCAAAPLGPYDTQALLEAPDPGARVRLLAELAGQAADSFAFRLSGE